MKSISRKTDPMVKIRSGFRLMLVAFAVLLHSPFVTAEEFTWRVQTGDSFSVRLEQSMTAKSRCEPQERIETSNAVVDMTLAIGEITDAGISARITIGEISLKLGTPTKDGSGQIDLNTRSEAKLKDVAESLRQELLAVRGAAFDIVFLPNGTLVSVTLDEETTEKFRSAPASSPLTAMFSKEGLQRMFSSTHVTFPDGDIAPGHTWKTGTAGDTEESPQLNWTYSSVVTRDQRKLHRIACTVPRSSQQSGPGPGSRQIRIDGVYLYDAELGVPVSGTITSHLGMATQYRELVIYTDIDTETTMTLTKN